MLIKTTMAYQLSHRIGGKMRKQFRILVRGEGDTRCVVGGNVRVPLLGGSDSKQSGQGMCPAQSHPWKTVLVTFFA